MPAVGMWCPNYGQMGGQVLQQSVFADRDGADLAPLADFALPGVLTTAPEAITNTAKNRESVTFFICSPPRCFRTATTQIYHGLRHNHLLF